MPYLDVFGFHPENGLNSLILNWCTASYRQLRAPCKGSFLFQEVWRVLNGRVGAACTHIDLQASCWLLFKRRPLRCLNSTSILVRSSLRGRTFSKQMAPSIRVKRLYPTDAKHDKDATFDVIFFHGLNIDPATAYENTWRTKDNTILWPQKWLPTHLENIRVFTVSYDAEPTKWFARGNTEDVHSIGQILLENVVIKGSDRIGSHPFALVGHSFGGLVIKALVNETTSSSRTAAKKFLENLKLVVFYAVPHSGADAETLTSYVNSFRRGAASSLPQNMKPFSTNMAKMSVMMEKEFSEKKINIYAFGEGKPTSQGKMVVEPASAMQLAGNNFYKLEDCNHTEVCKPVNEDHPSYSMLVTILRTSREGTKP